MAQLLIVLGITYLCEITMAYTNLPMPGSVVGMLLLFFLLQFKVIKLQQIEEGAGVLLKYLPIMFVPLGVGIYQYVDLVKSSALELVVILMSTTVLVMTAAGWTVQYLNRKAGRKHVV